MYFIQRKFIRKLAAVSSLLLSAGALAEPVGFWTGNGSIISYYDSQGRANMWDDEYPNGIRQDVTIAHPGYPVAFFQWQAAPGCERLEISAEAPNNVNMVDITVGNWNSRDNDVTFEYASLPFVIGNGNGEVAGILAAMGMFNFDYPEEYPDANWRVVSVAFKYPVTEESKVFATCTDQPPSIYPFAGPGKPIILEGNYRWNGNASIISRIFSDQPADVVRNSEWPNGAFRDITQVSPSPEKPVVFFQWMASEVCTELTIDAPELPPSEKQVTITSKPWYASNDDVSERVPGTLPITLHNYTFREEPPWRVIQVAFDYPVSQVAGVEAKCPDRNQGDSPVVPPPSTVATPLSKEALWGQTVEILWDSYNDSLTYEILDASISGCNIYANNVIDGGNFEEDSRPSYADVWYCDVTSGFFGTITIPYRLKDATTGQYSDSTITITVSAAPVSIMAGYGEKVKILSATTADNFTYQILADSSTSITGCDNIYSTNVPWLDATGLESSMGSDLIWYCDITPGFVGTITIPYRVTEPHQDRYNDSTITIVVSPAPPLPYHVDFHPTEGNSLFDEDTTLSLVGYTDYRWGNGATLKVGFDFGGNLDPSPVCQNRNLVSSTGQFLTGDACWQAIANEVVTVASQWSQFGNIHFTRSDWNEADIRIQFLDDGAHSQVGTKAMDVARNQPTMNLSLSFLMPPNKFNGTVLHEFGHAIGLEHEHNNPQAGYHWDLKKIVADHQAATNSAGRWDEAKVKFNITDPLENRVTLFSTAFDPQSIMIYSIPLPWVSPDDQKDSALCPDKDTTYLDRNNNPFYYCVAPNKELSAIDKEGIAQFYPYLPQPCSDRSLTFDPICPVTGIEVTTYDDAGNHCSPDYPQWIAADLNKGAGGPYIYLCLARNPNYMPVTSIQFQLNGGQCNSDGLIESDLNAGTRVEGDSIYLCVGHSESYVPIQDIVVTSTGNDGNFCPAGYEWNAADLNSGARGDFIHLCVSYAY